MISAKFGSKKFQVTGTVIYTPDELSISEELNIEEVEVKLKKPKVSVKGVKLQSLTFKVNLDSRFCTVDTELRFWKKTLLAKKSDFFYLGAFKIGKFFMTKYDVSDIQLTKSGAYRSAILSLTFTEDGKYANTKTINFEGTSKSNSVKNESTTAKKPTKASTIKIGTYVKPKSGTRWYYTAEGAINKTGKSGKAYNRKMKVSYIYQNGKAINPEGLGWMRPEDVDIV